MSSGLGDSAPQLLRELPSDVDLLEPLVEEAEAFLSGQIDDPELVYRAVLLLSEAATNAMKHGNGFDPQKKVRIELTRADHEIRIMVCDEGGGFDPGASADPLDQSNLMSTSGRGLFLIREMADRVSFDDDGRCVIITVAG